MIAKELRQKTLDELKKIYLQLMSEQFRLRMQKAMKQLEQAHLLRQKRKDVARVLMVLKEKEQEK